MAKEIYSYKETSGKKKVGKTLLLIFIAINMFSFFNSNIMTAYKKYSFLFFIFIMLAMFLFNKTIKVRSIQNIAFILFISFYALLSLFVNGGGVGSAVNLVYSLLICIVISDIDFNARDIKRIWYLILLVNVFLFYQSSSNYYQDVIISGMPGINPNVLAYVVLYTCMLAIALSNRISLKKRPLINLTIIILSAISITHFGARGSLLPLVIFSLIEFLVPKKIFKDKPIIIFITYVVVILGGLLLPALYLNMSIQNININLSITDKNFYSGREIIWGIFFNRMTSPINWLFGLGSNYQIFQGEPIDLHNNYLGMIGNFGIIGFSLYFGFILHKISYICQKKSIDEYIICLMTGFLCVLINGYFEATIYYSPIFLLTFIYLGLALNGSKLTESIKYYV